MRAARAWTPAPTLPCRGYNRATRKRLCQLHVRFVLSGRAWLWVRREIPPVPLTVEGYSVLHQMMRFRWPAWRGLAAAQKNEIVDEARRVLAAMEENASGQSGLFSLIGHKGDLMLVHFRQSFAELNQAELQMAQVAA